MKHALTLTKPKVVVSELSKLQATMQAAPPAARHLLLRGEPPAAAPSAPSAASNRPVDTYLELLRRGAARRPDPATYRAVAVKDRREHVSFVHFSSGTTGLPKGVRLPDSSMGYICTNIG